MDDDVSQMFGFMLWTGNRIAPSFDFRITEASDPRVTEDGSSLRITENDVIP